MKFKPLLTLWQTLENCLPKMTYFGDLEFCSALDEGYETFFVDPCSVSRIVFTKVIETQNVF